MSGDIFKGISDLRLVLDTETDADSPDNETTYAAIRKAIEVLMMLMVDTGASGTLTSDPPNDTTGYATDTAAGFVDDEHNGRTLIFTDGLAIGEKYTIDDTVAASNRVECTGDNLYSAGARSGDNYKILYDIITNVDGHDHDDINSPKVVLADSQVTSSKLKQSSDIQSTTSTSLVNKLLAGGEYGFYPMVKSNLAGDNVIANITASGGADSQSYITCCAIARTGTSATVYVLQTYVTSSGDVHWLWLLKEKATGKTTDAATCPDHPCFGNGHRPDIIQHPFLNYDPKKHDIIVVNPTLEQVAEATPRMIPDKRGGFISGKQFKDNDYTVDEMRPERSLLEVFDEDFELIENKDADWPDIPITVGLPKIWKGEIVNDYRFMVGQNIEPIRVPIKKPDFITPLGIKLKGAK